MVIPSSVMCSSNWLAHAVVWGYNWLTHVNCVIFSLGSFRSINCGAPGSWHDAAVLRDSTLFRNSDRIPKVTADIIQYNSYN